jgi:uncharacterized protein (DUF488 family)
MTPLPQIWTIGHSTHGAEEFIGMLRAHRIEALADVRRFPGSRRYPHFGLPALRDSLTTAGIAYEHFPELGGRREPRPDSHNTAWRNEAFRGYADYMETSEFVAGIERLKELARNKRTALMCAEAVWWRCHRGLIADYLKAEGTEVVHILGATQSEAHPYTSAAHLVAGRLTYSTPATPTLF